MPYAATPPFCGTFHCYYHPPAFVKYAVPTKNDPCKHRCTESERNFDVYARQW